MVWVNIIAVVVLCLSFAGGFKEGAVRHFFSLLAAYPIIDWLAKAVTGAGVMVWLVNHLAFVQNMLPEIFRNAPLMAALL